MSRWLTKHFILKIYKIRVMKEVLKNLAMYFALMVLGVGFMAWIIDIVVWYLYIMLTDTWVAVGYLGLAAIVIIGISQAIDKLR